MAISRDRLRSTALYHRRKLAKSDCLAWSESIQARTLALPIYRAAEAVALYSPIANEVDNRAILADALASGKKVYFPKLNTKVPAFAQIDSPADLVSGRFGILEPSGSAAMTFFDPDRLVVFVPGLLFDRRGNRLGRGGGWYDQALDDLGGAGVFIGLAYEVQIIENITAESWDRKVHLIITENELIDCDCASRSSSRIHRLA